MPSLIALKNWIKAKKIINLQSLSNHFNVDPDNLRPLLNILISKGYICERS